VDTTFGIKSFAPALKRRIGRSGKTGATFPSDALGDTRHLSGSVMLDLKHIAFGPEFQLVGRERRRDLAIERAPLLLALAALEAEADLLTDRPTVARAECRRIAASMLAADTTAQSMPVIGPFEVGRCCT
jgi:hypothetical protein